jgi:hypothetical protein
MANYPISISVPRINIRALILEKTTIGSYFPASKKPWEWHPLGRGTSS